MNEKYGIELEAKVNKFKAVMQATANYVKNLGQDMKDAMTVAPKSTLYQGMSKDDLQKELEKQQSIAKQMQENMNAKNIDPLGSVYKKSKQMYAEAITRVSILKNRLRETNDELQKTENITTKSDNGLSNAFKKGIANIKRFSFYLLGARSVFSLFMKYQRIYNQYNEQMMYQTELSQNAIALSLGPAFEILGNAITYVSIGFARFIELLTGINVLSKVSTKGIRDYNKSLKETQTLVAGVDEITNLTTPNSTGLAGQYQALEDFRKKAKEVSEWFDNQKWIKSIKETITTTIDTFRDWYNNGGKKDLISIGGELKDIWNNLTDIFKSLTDLLGIDINKIFKGVTLGISNTTILIDIIASSISFLLNAITDIVNLDFDKLKEDLSEWKQEMSENFDALKNNAKKAFDKTEEQSNIAFDSVEKDIKNSKEAMEGLTKPEHIITAKLEIEKNSISKFKNIMKAVGGTINALNPTSGILFNGALKLFDKLGYSKGLDYVPYDEYPALLHKGEAIVPAKYNPAIHSAGNDYTNALLETLVTKMDDLASRPNIFEVDGQKFASATYDLYRNEENRQNYNANVVVR